MSTDKYNMRNPAVKRILQEVREMQNNASDDFMSLPVPDNIFEWQFAIRGAEDTEFEGGIYHGRIQLPPEYPFKPPAFMLLTQNGRFETQTKICLSISQYHPEHWQPSWSVRTALVALIAFMPTKADGALGSLSYTPEERSALALKSRSKPPKFGNTERQELIDKIHEYMLEKVPPPKKQEPAAIDSAPTAPAPDVQTPPVVEEAAAPQDDSQTSEEREPGQSETGEVSTNEPQIEVQEHPVVAPALVREDAVPVAAQERVQQIAAGNGGFISRLLLSEDLGLTLVAIGLTIAIIAILIKKLLAIPIQSVAMDS